MDVKEESKCNQKHETIHILVDDDKGFHEEFYIEEQMWVNYL